MSTEEDQKLFLSIGLDEKRAKDTLKNKDLTALLKTIIDEASVSKGCDKSIGNLLYSLATSQQANSPIRSNVSKAIGEEKIKTTIQFQAATQYLKDNKEFNQDTFNTFCGVGVVITPEQIQKAIDDLFNKKATEISEKKWHIPIGDLLNPLKESLKWADLKEVKTMLDKKLETTLGPKVVEAKEKKVAATTAAPVKKIEEQLAAITLKQDASLPTPKRLKIRECSPKFANQRVEVHAWAHHVRNQKKIVFLELRDGTGFLQCVLSGDLVHPSIIDKLLREATVKIVGTLVIPPADKKCPGGVELQADYWELLGSSNADLEGVINQESNVDHLFDQRHIMMRGTRASSIMKIRSLCLFAFRQHFFENHYMEVTPPTLVNTYCEGGSELFTVDYFGKPAYLTQSSQLYLETMLPVLGDNFTITQSYRAEKARTRRHLTEFLHLEAECPFITYEELQDRIEFLVVDVCEKLFKMDPELILSVNPDFKVPKRPFMRMNYSDAIEYCKKNGIQKKLEDGTEVDFEFGDDIPEAQERRMNDQIGEPIFLCRFPAEMKAFYMARCPEDRTLTESLDLLMPGVGEIVGGSMRISDFNELVAAYKKAGLDTDEYYWFTDQRKYGTTQHGGYGLGVERFLTWMLKEEHIRNVCVYQRTKDRITP
ncbi:hypothetical protein ACTFIU_001676 [Dictyostelium citrinum]